ncbi:MAG: pyridoxal phosphate-dependent aminotransferase [Gemmataceae bacterium]|nr:pyridoxal phosphate-dependent aminotransferase [Gemmataceae bacterium]
MNPLRTTGRAAALCPTAVNRILQEARQLQAEGCTLVSLMRGQPDTPTPDHIVEAAQQALRAGRTGYPDNQGEPDLRRAVAEKLARDNGLTCDPDREILITDGATAGLCTALAALIEPGDDVLLPDPIYDAYAAPVALWGGRCVPVASTIRAGRFAFDRVALEAAVTPQTRLLLLNTPWNPTGTVLTAEELREVTAFAAAHNLGLLSDEIYETLVYDGRRHVSPAALSPEARRRTVLVNSLSKSYAMTGWRVGYVAAPAEAIQAMLLVLQQFSRGPATFVQDAAACALRSDPNGGARMRAEYQGRRDRVVERLGGLPGVTPLVPEGGLFVMLDVRGLGKPSEEVRRFLLREAGVVLIHGAAYGPAGEGTLRVSFAAGGAALERGLERLRDGLLRLARERATTRQAASGKENAQDASV